MKKYIIFIMLLCTFSAKAQQDIATLNIVQFLDLVKQYHPVVKLANISIQKSDADITIARGAFNPILNNVISNKTFDNVNYYNYINPNITIPTWYGVEVSTGIENLSGNRFDPSETVGKSSYFGANIQLLKNLVLDKRRAYLAQSKIYNQMAGIEKQASVNTILLEAAIQFWEWVNAYQQVEIVTKNLTVSKQRFEMIKKTFLNGERPAIDTVEARSQYQTFEFQQNEALLLFQKESLELSAYLWQANNNPYQLPQNVVPIKDWDNEYNMEKYVLNLDELLKRALQFHPELQLYKKKLDVLSIDKKLKFQELLPKLDFRYNHLSKGFNTFGSSGFLLQNNYQYGLKFEMPLLFSAGRGEYQKAKLKIEENQIANNQKALTIELKVKSYYMEFQNLQSQIQLQKNMVINFEKLLKAEEILFNNGESSLFLINSRENKVLESAKKLIELKTKYFKTIYAMQWSGGLLQ